LKQKIASIGNEIWNASGEERAEGEKLLEKDRLNLAKTQGEIDNSSDISQVSRICPLPRTASGSRHFSDPL